MDLGRAAVYCVRTGTPNRLQRQRADLCPRGAGHAELELVTSPCGGVTSTRKQILVIHLECGSPSVLYRFMKGVVLGPALRLIGRPSVEGLDNVPATGGAILASNHLAVIDSFYLGLVCPRPVYFFAKEEYFNAPGILGGLKRRFFESLNQIPVDRSGGTASQSALEAAAAVVSAGNIWGVYPEGTRSPDGRLYRGRTGMARVAAVTGAPVVPVAMFGTGRMNPPGTHVLRPTRIHIRVGKPIMRAKPAAPVDYAWLRGFTDEVMAAIREISEQDYVDEYAKGFRADS